MHSDMPTIAPLNDRAFIEAHEGRIDFPYTAWAGTRQRPDGSVEVLGVGGLYWRFNRCWLWFSRFDGQNTHGVLLVRQARRMLRKAVQLGETDVYCWRDDELPSSKRLLEVVGFRYVGRDRLIKASGSDDGEIEVWKWHHSE